MVRVGEEIYKKNERINKYKMFENLMRVVHLIPLDFKFTNETKDNFIKTYGIYK